MATTRELSEDEILATYGALLWTALTSFGEDPTYFVSMSEQANLIEYKRGLWDARAEASRQSADPVVVRDLTEKILISRGVQTPRRRGRAA